MLLLLAWPASHVRADGVLRCTVGGLIATLVRQRCAEHATGSESKTADGVRAYGSPQGLLPWTGTVLSAPLVKVRDKDATPLLVGIAKLFSVLLPKMTATGLDANGKPPLPCRDV